MPRQNTSPADYPQAVLQQIEQLALNIAVARKRRGETQAQWAKKLGVSQPTFARIERGDPGVAMASYVMCMWLINSMVNLADLIAPLNDRAALEREVAKASKKRKAATPTAPAPIVENRLPVKQAAVLAVQEPPSGGVSTAVESGVGKRNPTAEGLAALMLKTPPSPDIPP